VKIAIIDDGVYDEYVKGNVSHYSIENKKIVEAVGLSERKITHGSICANIVSNIVLDVEIVDINIFQSKRACVKDAILALEWCSENSVNVVNMSFGTLNYWDYKILKEQVEKMVSEGCYIVAAFNNYGIKSYPAALEKVFGVRADQGGGLRSGEFTFIKSRGLRKENCVVACWDLDISMKDELAYKISSRSNSFVAPVITAEVATILKCDPSAEFEKVLHFLEKGAVHGRGMAKAVKKIFSLTDTTINIPVIVFKSKMYKEVIRKLEKEGYNVIVATDSSADKENIPLTMYCEENGMVTRDVLKTLIEVYAPDILILLTDNIANEEVDIWVMEVGQGYQLKQGKKVYKCKSGEDIYQLICDIFN